MKPFQTLIQKQLEQLEKMIGRFDRKFSSYTWKASAIALSIAVFGILSALRDSIGSAIPKDNQGWMNIFIVVGGLTTLATFIANSYKWAERRAVALELKIKCSALLDDACGKQALLQAKNSEDLTYQELYTMLATGMAEVRQVSARNFIDPDDRPILQDTPNEKK